MLDTLLALKIVLVFAWPSSGIPGLRVTTLLLLDLIEGEPALNRLIIGRIFVLLDYLLDFELDFLGSVWISV